MTDSRLVAVMNTLATCLCAQIIADGSPEPCFCGVMPGEAALADYSFACDEKNGMAWVRLVTAYPSAALGAASLIPNNCALMLGADLEVGVLRGIPSGDDAGNPPTQEQLTEVTNLMLNDTDSIRRAILCCQDVVSMQDVMLGQWTPAGPQGGLVGGSFAVAIQVP